MKPTTRRSFLRGSATLAGAGFTTPLLAGTRRRQDAATTPRGPSEDERTFLAAILRGDTPEVRRRLAASPALANAADEAGRTALVLARVELHDDIVAALLEHDPALHLSESIMLPDWDRALALVDADPSILEHVLPIGGTALYAGARVGSTDLWKLQGKGALADGNPRGPLGVTPAYGAFECKDRRDAIRAAVSLLSNGAHANSPQRGGDSLLHIAARRGDAYLVRYLLRRGADPEARNQQGQTPLHQAEHLEHAEVVAVLENPDSVERDDYFTRYAYDANGDPVQWPDLSDLTPAEHGAVTGPSHVNYIAVKLIVEKDPRRSFCRSSQNELAVEACGHIGTRNIINYHLAHGVPQSLCTSLSVGDLPRAKALLKQYPNAIHERGPHDFPPMYYAAIGKGNVEAAELLLAHGASVDQESQMTTALHEATLRGQIDLVRYLAEQGADLNVVGYRIDRNGQSPLQTAVLHGRDDVAKLLRQLGAT